MRIRAKQRGGLKRRRATGIGAETQAWSRFNAEAAYAQSIVQSALGDQSGSLSALQRSLALNPGFAPAIFSLGTVEYQRGRKTKGRELFHSLLALPKRTPDLCEIIDKAGDFLIQRRQYRDGLELYRAAAARFPRVAAFHQGVGCCAGHRGLHDEAIAASTRAVRLDSRNAQLLSDLGWCLCKAGRLKEAEKVLSRAVAMDPSDNLARGNLRYCRARMTKLVGKKRDA